MGRHPIEHGSSAFLEGGGWGDTLDGDTEGDCWGDVFYHYRTNVREDRPAPYRDYEDVRVPY